VAAPRRPILLPGVIDEAAEDVRRRRTAIARAVGEDASEAALVLAPLLERYEAPAVAAALYALWVQQPAPMAEAPAAAEGATEKLWVGIGKRDEVGVSELVAFLTREVAVDRAMIGRIEVRDTFTLIEVPRAEASRIAEALSGRTIRRRRLVARVDRGAPAGGPRPPRGRAPA
jgi:ATP-dependent RNA helicase DeaD